jgi:hypothetical protein
VGEDDTRVEIRPIVADEALEYVGSLPYFNGLPQWEPARRLVRHLTLPDMAS